MSADYKARVIYNATIHDITKSEETWRDVLRLAGNIYRYEFDNVVMVYAQRPHASLVADYDTWKKVDRYVKRGSKGICIFKSQALKPWCRYVFDLADTDGRKQELTWNMDDEMLLAYVNDLVKREIIATDEVTDIEVAKDVFKDFTKQEICRIINENRTMYGNEMLTGRVNVDDESKTPEVMEEDIAYKSIFYEVATRCGFDLISEEWDLGSIVNIRREDDIYALGSLVCDVSCTILKEIGSNVKRLERERRMRHGSNQFNVSRGERITLSEHHNGGTGRFNESGQIRTDRNGLSERELSAEVPESGEIRKAGGSASGGGRGSEQHAGYDNGAVFRKAQTEESGINDGNVEDSPARDDGGGGNCATGTREPISLETEQELNKELNELESFGTEREAEYKQASLFDFMEVGKIGSTLTDKEKEQNNKFQYSFIQPKKETVIPHDYIVKTLMHGSGFTGGKKRIYDMFQTEADAKTRAKLIKKEYGQGGVGWPLEGYGLHGYDSFSPKGLRLQWRDEEGEKEGYLSWNAVEAELGVLIMLGEYYTPEVVIDRTDTEEVREEIEDREEVLNEEMVPAEEAFAEEKQILDDFIIPDEAEQMGVPDNIRVMQDAGEDFHLGTWDTKDANDFARTDWNIDAIRLLKEIEADGRAATPEEQKVLSRYVGWGGLAVVFDEKNLPFHSRYLQLKELLSSKEYEAARATVNNAFYTPSVVASVITSAISRFGFHKGNILEPSMGIGNFFGCLPENMRECNRYGVEIDDITGRIARLLYPDAQIQIKGFEETNFPDNFFDVVIGNVPFGDYKVYDPEYNKLNFKIHDYFVAKAIDQTRPGGMVAVITTKGTLDKKNPAVRKYLAERAKLVGAVRLPDSTFMGNAGTQVTTDILFFQKRERKESIEPDWVHLGVTKDGIPVNSYFVEHPELMLGTMEYDKGRFGEASAYTRCVNREEGFNLFESLQRAVDSIHAKIKDFEFVSEEEEKSLADIPANPDVKNYTYAFQDGKLYFRKDSRMFEQKAGDKVMERIKGLHKIRELTRHLIEIQKEGCSEEELADAQKKLNEVYDSFVKKNGYITSKANASAFRDDSDYPLLCSLEKVDEDGVVTKADMFTKQTIRAKADVTKVETAVEALNVSVNEYGYVNIPFMLSIYKPKLQAVKENIAEQTGESTKEISFSEEAIMQLSRERLIEELTGVIFLNPERYNENDRNAGWETADEYLSGNVRDKFRVAKAFATDYPELFGSNVEALKQVQPKDLDASEIEVRIGTTWIEPQDYEQFIYDLLETPRWSRARRTANGNTGITVNLNKFNMEWFIENKSRDKNSVRASKTFGTSRMDAYSIFESTLNLRTITIRDRIDDGDGKFHYEVNKNETMLAREKQNQMKEAFKNWIWEEPERRQKYVDYYNETFNNVRLREYDGSYLEFPGMNPDIQLNSHQKNAVARILMGNNTLLAHCVGAGKSFEMMAAIMEQKRLGLSNKAALVVPKSLVGQTASEFLRLYPSANILVAGEHDFSKARRQQFIARIATGDYDAVIACVKEDVALRDKMKMEVPDFAIKIGGITYTERVDGGTLLLKEVASAKTGMTTKIAEFKGFEVLVEKNFMGVNYLVLKGNAEYKVELSASTVGNMIKLENCFNDLQERIVFLEQKLEDYQRDMEQAKIQYEKPFEYEQELADKLKRQYALNAELDLENKRDDDIPKEEKEQNRVAEKLTEYPSKG